MVLGVDTDIVGTTSSVGIVAIIVTGEVVVSLLVLVGTAGETMSVSGGIPLILAWPTVSTVSSNTCGCSGGG